MRAFRCDDFLSDHSLMAVKIRVKLSAQRKARTARQWPYDCEKLRYLEIRSQLVLKLTNRFETLGPMLDESPDTARTAIRKANNNTAYETLGRKKSPKDEWISIESWNLIRKRTSKMKSLNTLSSDARQTCWIRVLLCLIRL